MIKEILKNLQTFVDEKILFYSFREVIKLVYVDQNQIYHRVNDNSYPEYVH